MFLSLRKLCIRFCGHVSLEIEHRRLREGQSDSGNRRASAGSERSASRAWSPPRRTRQGLYLRLTVQIVAQDAKEPLPADRDKVLLDELVDFCHVPPEGRSVLRTKGDVVRLDVRVYLMQPAVCVLINGN